MEGYRWRLVHGDHAELTRAQWQLLVDVLDGYKDQRKLEDAQDALTLAAPHSWIEEAEAEEGAKSAEETRPCRDAAGQ